MKNPGPFARFGAALPGTGNFAGGCYNKIFSKGRACLSQRPKTVAERGLSLCLKQDNSTNTPKIPHNAPLTCTKKWQSARFLPFYLQCSDQQNRQNAHFQAIPHHGKTLAFSRNRTSTFFAANAAGQTGPPPDDATGLIPQLFILRSAHHGEQTQDQRAARRKFLRS